MPRRGIPVEVVASRPYNAGNFEPMPWPDYCGIRLYPVIWEPQKGPLKGSFCKVD